MHVKIFVDIFGGSFNNWDAERTCAKDDWRL